MNHDLIELVRANDHLADLDPASRRLALRALVTQASDDPRIGATVGEIADEIEGFGPLSAVMRDPDVTDVFVNGPFEVWVERCGSTVTTDIRFRGNEHLRSFVERLVGSIGGRIDASQPIADARLADGSRLHVVLPPVAPAGPLLSIRKFPRTPRSIDDLVELSLLDGEQAGYLVAAVRARKTIAVSGGTGAGKTTLMNALLGHVGDGERLVVIEETPELHPACRHAVCLAARPANVEGKGAIDLAQLVRNALRMRPDRIVLGEVRGAESLWALAAMSTGHEGSMVTVHARSASDAISRMVALALQAASGMTEASLAEQFRRAFDLVVHLRRTSSGQRNVAEIVEIDGD